MNAGTTNGGPVDVASYFRLDRQVAVVTGASAGLGARFARVLHAAGAQVALGARRLDRLEALAAELGDDALAVGCDIARDDDRQQLVATALDRFGQIDLLVNNAGIGTTVAAEDETLDHFREVVEVNLTALFHLCQLAGREMLARGHGSIINVASILGLVASAPIKQASYTASKGAVVNLTRELSAQWSRKGVRVNALAPGWFASEMTHDMWHDEQSMEYVRRNTPMGRGGQEHELDAALLFLAGPGSSFVTGHVLTVDGGWTSR